MFNFRNRTGLRKNFNNENFQIYSIHTTLINIFKQQQIHMMGPCRLHIHVEKSYKVEGERKQNVHVCVLQFAEEALYNIQTSCLLSRGEQGYDRGE